MPCNGLMFFQTVDVRAGLLGMALLLGFVAHAWGGDSVCSVVRIEIQQELTLERQAFDAHMRVVNGLDVTALEDVEINVWFLDDEDNPVQASSNPDNTDASFFIALDRMSGVTNVDGSGTIEPGGQADIHWLIIPSPGAGGQQPSGELYQVGATLTYSFGGESETIEVAPDFIQVRPTPLLQLDYFLPSEVIANDPLTPETEPSVPFELGVRVTNSGYGEAKNLAIESAQPEIVDNLQGLLIQFELLGAQVDDQPAVNSLLADFGNLAPGMASTAVWRMTTSLYGHFVSFEADYYHSDELGGELTSLIDRVDTHTLVGTVINDLPGRDSIRDFLAHDGSVLRLYESDGIDTPVSDFSGSVSLEQNGSEPGAEYYSLTFPESTGPVYVVMPDPTGGEGTIASVWRADGKRIPEVNFWQSRSKESGSWESLFHVFDTNSGGEYEVVAEVALAPNRPPELEPISDQELTAGEVLELTFSASDPDDDLLTFSIDPLPDDAQLDDGGDGIAQFTWSTTDADVGQHEFTVSVSDGEYQASDTFQVNVLEDPTGSYIILAESPIEVIKGETANAFTIQLDSKPAADVWVPIASSDETRGVVEAEGVLFTTTNWDSPKTVSVHGIGNDYFQGDLEFEILIGPSESADEHYDALEHPPLAAVNRDTEEASVLVTPVAGLATAGEATVAYFEARLNGPPAAPVSVIFESSHPDLAVPDPSTLVIYPDSWDEPAEVAVRGQPVADEDAAEIIYLIAAVMTESADENFVDAEVQPVEMIHRGGDTWGVEAGTVSLPAVRDFDSWVQVDFAQPFRLLPVVTWIADDGEPDPAAVRIRNVTLDGFEATQVEPPGSHDLTQETTMHFLAVEPGVHPLPGGSWLEAGTAVTDKVQTGPGFGGPPQNDWESISFDADFAVPPVFLTGIQTLENEVADLPNAGSRPWFTVASDDVRPTGAGVALERSGVNEGDVQVPETIGYVAIVPGAGEFASGAGRTFWESQEHEIPAGPWRDGCEPFAWFEAAPDNAVLQAHQLTRTNRHGGWLRLCTDDDGRIGLVFDQDVERTPVRGTHDEDVRALWFSQPFFTRLLGED